MLAFASLLSFYGKFKYDLRPFNPLPKFLCIKSIIFCIFWQGILIALLLEFEIVSPPADSSYTKSTLAVALQDFLICIEMAIASMVNMYAFDYKPYAGESIEEIFLQRRRSDSLSETLLLPKEDIERPNGKQEGSSNTKKVLPRGYRRPPSLKKSNNQEGCSKDTNGKQKKQKRWKPNSDVELADENVNSRPGSFDTAPSLSPSYTSSVDDETAHNSGRERTNSSSKIMGTPLLGLVSNADFHQKRQARLAQSMDGSRNRELSLSDEYYESGGREGAVGLEIEIEAGEASAKFRSKNKKQGVGLKGIMNKNFAHNTAIRDFNETMPVSIYYVVSLRNKSPA